MQARKLNEPFGYLVSSLANLGSSIYFIIYYLSVRFMNAFWDFARLELWVFSIGWIVRCFVNNVAMN